MANIESVRLPDNSVYSFKDSVSGYSSTLSGLTDINVTTPTNGQVLSYDNVNSKWVNADSGVADKADKVAGATSGNLAGLDGNGNLTDSGHAIQVSTTDLTAGTSPLATGVLYLVYE